VGEGSALGGEGRGGESTASRTGRWLWCSRRFMLRAVSVGAPVGGIVEGEGKWDDGWWREGGLEVASLADGVCG
jgi:hypothetical protein